MGRRQGCQRVSGVSDLRLDGYKDIREAKTHGVGAELLFTVFIIQVSRYLQLQNVQHSRT